MQKYIFHIVSQRDLKDGLSVYEPESVAINGYIHCAEAAQIEQVARRKFGERRDAVLLKIDESRVAAEIRYENLSGGDELFPHIYGSLNMDAVVNVEPLVLSESPEISVVPLTIANWPKVERLSGVLALIGECAVGWCAIGPQEAYPQYEQAKAQQVSWAVPCLYIDPAVDRGRVARALIDAAVGLAFESNAVTIEGPPSYWLPGDAAAIAAATTTFLENGFELVGPGPRMPHLRRTLRRGNR
jgi:uncharacterized protein (DUF952 family)